MIETRLFFALLAMFCSAVLLGQTDAQDSLVSVETEQTRHSVAKATWYSTALPGLGQVYNRKIWKVPIIYTGLGICTYLAIDNNRQYQDFLGAFYQRIDSTQSDVYEGIYTPEQLIQLQNIYRKWRDLAIIVGVVIYALNIVDAHVDAHLFEYNVNRDLSLRLEPGIMHNGLTPAVGFSLSLDFR